VENVDQFVRVLYKPALWKTLNRTQRGIAGHEDACQLSAVYSLAVLSLSEQDCVVNFGERRDVLLNRFKADVEHGLSSLNLTTTHRLSSLQTLLLHISYLVWTGSHTHASSLLGLALRIAQRLGVHRDGATNFGMSHWQTELRRRLWHYLVFLDVFCIENQGLESVLPSGFADVRLPQNNDDADWDISDASTVRPTPKEGFTDMSFALMQYETGAILRVVFEHSVPRSEEYVTFHAQLLDRTREEIEKRYLVKLDENDIRQSLTLDIANLTFQRIQINQLRPFERSGICNNTTFRKELEHRYYYCNTLLNPADRYDRILLLCLDFCDTVQRIRDQYASRRLDWAIIRVFSWHALATELSTALSGDNVISTSDEARRAREKIAKVFRDRPSIAYLRGGDGLWEPLERLRAELEMRTRADQDARVQETFLNTQTTNLMDADFAAMEGVWDGSDLWSKF
jgi:hypothetical protein